jgi:hypothetical protein
MTQHKDQAVIDDLMDEILDLRQENDRLKSENRILGGGSGMVTAIRQRSCYHCHRRMPDGPVYFPGYFEEPSADLATEAYRYFCVYCRAGR